MHITSWGLGTSRTSSLVNLESNVQSSKASRIISSSKILSLDHLKNTIPTANWVKFVLNMVSARYPKLHLSILSPKNTATIEKAKNAAKTAFSKSGLEFKKLGQGKAKVVWVRGKQAYFTPVQGLFSSVINFKERELKEEVKTARSIKDNLPRGRTGEYLALDMKEIKDEQDKIGGHYTVKTTKAEGDIDGYLRDNPQTFSETFEFAKQFLNGMADLHAVNRIHGDVKAENLLFYKGPPPCVKVSDFGKTQHMTEKTRCNAYRKSKICCTRRPYQLSSGSL